MKAYYTCIMAFLAIVLTSCERKELPVKPHVPGNITTATVNLGDPYQWQIFYSLKTNSVVSQNIKTSWDIGCEASVSGYHIVLNTSKSMFAFNTGKTDFASISYNDTSGFIANEKWDASSGNWDSTAVGDWRTAKPVYIIDKGYDQKGAYLGREKVQLLSVTDSNYSIRFGQLNGTGDTTIAVKKDTACNLAFVSFTSQAQVTVEPPRQTWDIEFTQYTYIFYTYTPPLPYLVTGCLLNRYNTYAVLDTVDQFSQIAYSNVTNCKFTPDISTIGYTWKTYNGTDYTINTNYVYIIQAASGLYYKFQFIGYYNSAGAEGNPQWEYQQL